MGGTKGADFDFGNEKARSGSDFEKSSSEIRKKMWFREIPPDGVKDAEAAVLACLLLIISLLRACRKPREKDKVMNNSRMKNINIRIIFEWEKSESYSEAVAKYMEIMVEINLGIIWNNFDKCLRNHDDENLLKTADRNCKKGNFTQPRTRDAACDKAKIRTTVDKGISWKSDVGRVLSDKNSDLGKIEVNIWNFIHKGLNQSIQKGKYEIFLGDNSIKKGGLTKFDWNPVPKNRFDDNLTLDLDLNLKKEEETFISRISTSREITGKKIENFLEYCFDEKLGNFGEILLLDWANCDYETLISGERKLLAVLGPIKSLYEKTFLAAVSRILELRKVSFGNFENTCKNTTSISDKLGKIEKFDKIEKITFFWAGKMDRLVRSDARNARNFARASVAINAELVSWTFLSAWEDMNH